MPRLGDQPRYEEQPGEEHGRGGRDRGDFAVFEDEVVSGVRHGAGPTVISEVCNSQDCFSAMRKLGVTLRV